LKDLTVMDDDVFRRLLRVPPAIWKLSDYTFTTDDNSRFPTTTIEFTRNDDREYTENQLTYMERAKELFDDKIQEALNSLRKDYEWRLGDECVGEWIKSNEIQFTEDGEVF
jgi:hypothetical protein